MLSRAVGESGANVPTRDSAAAAAAGCEVFVSYRRAGGSELAQLVRRSLHDRGYRAFVDVHDLGAGPFDQSLLSAIRGCVDVVVLLTPGSLDRCANEGDWFRTEIAAALRSGKNVVPLRTAGFQMPPAGVLADDIAALRMQQGVSYVHEHSEASIEKLCRLLRARPVRWTRRAAIASAVLLVLSPGAVWAWYRLRRRPGDGAGGGVDDGGGGGAAAAATLPSATQPGALDAPDIDLAARTKKSGSRTRGRGK